MKMAVFKHSPTPVGTGVAVLLWLVLLPSATFAKPVERQLPTSCETLVEFQQVGLFDVPEDRLEASWNRYYRDGQAAITRGDLQAALQNQCFALSQSRGFDESDWRYAEALDELGRIHYLLEDYNASEEAQGAAVAELLLAVGPDDQGPPSRNVDLFIERLGLVYAQQGRSDLTQRLLNAPYLIFELGYLPFDRTLAQRLDWLASEYLGLEDFPAADALMQLSSEIE